MSTATVLHAARELLVHLVRLLELVWGAVCTLHLVLVEASFVTTGLLAIEASRIVTVVVTTSLAMMASATTLSAITSSALSESIVGFLEHSLVGVVLAGFVR